jgi:hypothetical protein
VTVDRDARIIAQHEHWVELAHRRMTSSYIGGPRPELLGDAERLVSFLEQQGWSPPIQAPEVDEAIKEVMRSHEFTAGMAFGVPVDAYGEFAEGITKAALRGAGAWAVRQVNKLWPKNK